MRLLIALLFASLVLFAACGDDDAAPTDTPEPTASEPVVSPGQETPNDQACTADELEGTYVSTEGAAGHAILTFEIGEAARSCQLLGPPELRWYDADGNGLGVPFIPNACESGNEDYDTCVFDGAVDLAGSDKVRAVVSVANAGVLEPCGTPKKMANVIGFQFPGVPLDVQIDLPNDIELQTCFAQVELLAYGPAPAN